MASDELTDDQVKLIFMLISPIGLFLIGALVLGFWELALTKALEYRLVVPVSENPVVTLPKSQGVGSPGGVGLDEPRCWIAVGAALVLLLLTIAAARIYVVMLRLAAQAGR